MHSSLLTCPADPGPAAAALPRRGSCSPVTHGHSATATRNPFLFPGTAGVIDGARYAAAAGPLSPAAPSGRPRS